MLFSGGPIPSTRNKYVLDPSVQSGPNYGQTANMYAPPQPTAQFNNQSYGSSPSNSYNQFAPQPFASAAALNPFQPYNQPSTGLNPLILSPSSGALLPGVPPIELAQQAMPQQIQRNPTPPPGWNDPPPLTKARQVNLKY